MELKESIGRNIVKKREKENMTQQSLASKSGLSISYLRQIEHGAANITLDVLERISFGLGTSVDDLMHADTTGEQDPDIIN